MQKSWKLAAALTGVAIAGLAGPSVAFGAPGATVTPNTNVTDGQTLTVAWSGFTAGQVVSISQCKKSIADPTFVATTDCEFDSANLANSDPSGGGSLTRPALVGVNANGDWACLPVSAANPGVPRFDTCYIRIAGNAFTDTSSDIEIPITFGSAPPVVPEAPVAVLLPLAALGILGGAYFVTRNRRSTSPA